MGERIPSESHDGDQEDEDSGAIPSGELDHGLQFPTPHEDLLEDEEYLLPQHSPEKSALIEEGAPQQYPTEALGLLDAMAYIGSLLGILVLVIAVVCVILYGLGVVNKFASYLIGSSNDPQDSRDDQQRHHAATIKQTRRETRRVDFDTKQRVRGASKRGHRASLPSRRHVGKGSGKGSGRHTLARSHTGPRHAVMRR